MFLISDILTAMAECQSTTSMTDDPAFMSLLPEYGILSFCRSCKQLEFVNLGSNTAIEDANNVLSELGKSCP